MAAPNFKVPQDLERTRAALEKDLRQWWASEQATFEALVKAGVATDAELWNDMPTIDSKVVALSSPIFHKHLGIPLNTKLIKPLGYESIDEMIADLVPRMIEAAAQSTEGNGAPQ